LSVKRVSYSQNNKPSVELSIRHSMAMNHSPTPPKIKKLRARHSACSVKNECYLKKARRKMALVCKGSTSHTTQNQTPVALMGPSEKKEQKQNGNQQYEIQNHCVVCGSCLAGGDRRVR